MAALREVPFAQYYGSVDSTPLFVLLAGLYFERTGDVETLRELWPAIEAALAWIDGPGDPDRRRFCRVSARLGTGSRQPGLEGFLRRDLSCRWPPGRRLHRAVRGAGLCLRRASGWRRVARGSSVLRRRPTTRRRSRKARRALRGGVLVSRARHLRARARRRETALQGANLECRPVAVHRHRRRGPRPHGRRRFDAAALLHRLGHSHRGAGRGPLQSDVLSQRLDLAA